MGLTLSDLRTIVRLVGAIRLFSPSTKLWLPELTSRLRELLHAQAVSCTLITAGESPLSATAGLDGQLRPDALRHSADALARNLPEGASVEGSAQPGLLLSVARLPAPMPMSVIAVDRPRDESHARLLLKLFHSQCAWLLRRKLLDGALVPSRLPARARQTLQLILEGHSEPHIAQLQGISASTVRDHVRQLYSRFDVSSRAGLLRAVLPLHGRLSPAPASPPPTAALDDQPNHEVSPQQCEALLRCLSEIEAVDPESTWKHALLRGMLAATGASVGLMHEMLKHQGRFVSVAHSEYGITPHQQLHYDRFLRRQLGDDRFTVLMLQNIAGANPCFTARREDLLDDAAWYASPMTRDTRLPGDVDGLLVTGWRLRTPGFIIGIGLHRTVGAPPFTEQQRDVLHAFHRELGWVYALRIPGVPAVAQRLTPRQRHVLYLLINAENARTISRKLHIGLDTVNEHIVAIYQAMNVANRTQLIVKCIRGAIHDG